MSQKQVISIEGNIGSGKSTLLEDLKDFVSDEKFVYLKEPVDEWTNVCDKNNKNILEKFYSDQERHSFAFQMLACTTKYLKLKEAIQENTEQVIISERSLDSDRNIFAEMLYDDGKIEDIHMEIYKKTHQNFSKDIPVDKFIYVYTDPEVAFTRCQKRNRKGEQGIPFEYLKKCHEYHEKWLANTKRQCQVYMFDGNIEKSDRPQEMLSQLCEFINL